MSRRGRKPSNEIRLETKHRRKDRTLLWGDAQPQASIVEDFNEMGVTRAAEGIRQNIVMGGHPLRLPDEIRLELKSGESSSHSEAKVNSGFTLGDKVKTGKIIGETSNLDAMPLVGPKAGCNEVTNKLIVRYMPI